LASAGFLNGSYTMSASGEAVSETNTPRNPFNVYLRFAHDNDYYDSTPTIKLNLKTGAQIPVEIISEVDRKIDDGHAQRGAFRFSDYSGGGTAPIATGGVGSGACVNTSAGGTWYISEGQANCGGTSLF
ncbi:MAG: hypothetical protein ACREUX_13055, partial [Burkholderiales bacterium]